MLLLLNDGAWDGGVWSGVFRHFGVPFCGEIPSKMAVVLAGVFDASKCDIGGSINGGAQYLVSSGKAS